MYYSSNKKRQKLAFFLTILSWSTILVTELLNEPLNIDLNTWNGIKTTLKSYNNKDLLTTSQNSNIEFCKILFIFIGQNHTLNFGLL